MYLLSLYISTNISIPGNSVDRLIQMGISPSSLLNAYVKPSRQFETANGIVDSLITLLYEDNYLKPWSNEYLLVKLVTKSF